MKSQTLDNRIKLYSIDVAYAARQRKVGNLALEQRKVMQQIHDDLIGLIGEDEPQYSNGRSARAIRNQLRAELRRTIETYTGVHNE